MKKLISVLCVLALTVGILAIGAVGAGAVESAQTAVDVKAGDEITYQLSLGGVSTKIIGCDFSFYYDPDIFEVTSVADFNDSTEKNKWQALINTDLNGEVRGNWSILSGVDFSEERHFITINYKAKAAGNGHLSYFIRYMYDDRIFESTTKPQITDYKFTCDVLVNGEKVIEKAAPELNTEETQPSGYFINSVTGDSKDADIDIPGTVVNKDEVLAGNGGSNGTGNGSANNNAGNNNVADANNNAGGNGGSANNNGSSSSKADGKTSEPDAANATPAATTAEGYYVTATDASGKVTATSDQAPVTTTGTKDDKGGTSPVLWIIIALIVLAGGGAAAFYFTKGKKAAAPADEQKPAETTKPEE